jgi:hypothetical protein
MCPTEDELAQASTQARSDEHLLTLGLSLTCFHRLGYFPRSGDVPGEVVEHVRRCLALREGTTPPSGDETAKLQRRLVRERLGVIHDPERARAVASAAIPGQLTWTLVSRSAGWTLIARGRIFVLRCCPSASSELTLDPRASRR